ncbi:DUF4181 domain-containing protein [Aquibacillus koreensis]|uniref:DUF4181 domain-containing protein n=1 Tax=Aquibacillus koreensis TaxID=279446 RepID=A0A9X4AJF9_9BACI|nr:DUF4181 domain-containing protein [Aquibacillus koreensis]MCT2536214.1 DUF4181 domain-containing protein [Aquibacillus koreensis]MDC3422021.1 DUF4181 domain-containing protein [Aquibacillus koreensis]
MGISTPILAIFIAISYNLLRKLLIGEEKKKISETAGKNVYRIGMGIFGLIGILTVIIALDLSDNNSMKWFWSIFITLILGFQSFMDWKFHKNSKEYIVPLIVLVLGIVYIFIFI